MPLSDFLGKVSFSQVFEKTDTPSHVLKGKIISVTLWRGKMPMNHVIEEKCIFG